ncbi:MAG: sugar kinase [bacterium]|nr:sugar kinase [bacterium]
MIERIIVVTKPTRLEELSRRHSHGQLRFLLERRGESLAEYEEEDVRSREALDRVVGSVPRGLAREVIPRDLVPRYLFRPHDLVVTIGPDGLVVNVAKYLDGQPILAVNPDPSRIDGALARFHPGAIGEVIAAVLRGACAVDALSLARATTSDGQELLAVNDFKIGRRDQVSSRYRVRYRGKEERQSSSGIIIATGVGSTGWIRSIVTGAVAIAEACGWKSATPSRLPVPFAWDSRHLLFAVQEPFPSRATKTSIAFGKIEEGEELIVVSEMADGGVIFSDGIADDAIPFNAGTTLQIGLADRTANLIRP